jgi:hypothetical protein
MLHDTSCSTRLPAFRSSAAHSCTFSKYKWQRHACVHDEYEEEYVYIVDGWAPEDEHNQIAICKRNDKERRADTEHGESMVQSGCPSFRLEAPQCKICRAFCLWSPSSPFSPRLCTRWVAAPFPPECPPAAASSAPVFASGSKAFQTGLCALGAFVKLRVASSSPSASCPCRAPSSASMRDREPFSRRSPSPSCRPLRASPDSLGSRHSPSLWALLSASLS